MSEKLVANRQKKNHQLSQLMMDNQVGLDVRETVLVLGRLRKGEI